MSRAPRPDPISEPTISVERAGKILGICKDAAYDAVQRGEIPAIRIGRRLIVPTAKLLEMLGEPVPVEQWHPLSAIQQRQSNDA